MNLRVLLGTLSIIDISNKTLLNKLIYYISTYIKTNSLEQEVFYEWLVYSNVKEEKLLLLLKSIINCNSISTLTNQDLIVELSYYLHSNNPELVRLLVILFCTTNNKEIIRLQLHSLSDRGKEFNIEVIKKTLNIFLPDHFLF